MANAIATNGGVLPDAIWDGGTPRTFTAMATATISGGQFVFCSGGHISGVGSTVSSFDTGSISCSLIEDADFINGIALTNVTSGNACTIATRGTFIANCGGNISGGQKVIANSGTIQYVFGDPATTGDKSHYSGTHCGRALTYAASGTNSYVLVDFNFS